MAIKVVTTVECNGRPFYATMEEGRTTTLAEVSFTCGAAYRYRVRKHDYAAYFLGFDNYGGERKYLFAVFDGDEWLGYIRTVDWARLKAMSRHPLVA